MKILKHFKSQILPWKVGKWTLSPHTKCPFWSLQPRSVPETLVKWEPSLGTERKSKPCRREAGHQPRAKWNRRDILARPELHSWQSWDWSWWRKPVDDLRVPATGGQVPGDKVKRVDFISGERHKRQIWADSSTHQIRRRMRAQRGTKDVNTHPSFLALFQ